MVGLTDMPEWKEREGETPLDDLSGLKLRIPNPTRALVNAEEGRNILKAEVKYLVGRLPERTAPFTLPWLRKLHREMFGDVWRWAGEFRTTNVSIGVDKHLIVMQLLHLLDDLHAWPDMGMEGTEQAARLHHRAVFVHPFVNGNGRWARMLANIWLRRQGQSVVLWPETTETVSPIRGAYLEALRKADGLDYGPLLDLHRQYQDR